MDALLDTAPCGFLSVADDGRILSANATLRTLLGYDEALDGTRFDDILPPGGRVFYQTHVVPLLALDGRAEEIAFSLRARDGRTVPVLLSAARTKRDGASVNDCVMLPMRQRIRYEEEILKAKKAAEAAARAKDEFLAVVSHELRTPLGAILGWARLLAGDTLDETTRVRAAATIERNARSQAQLIDDILDVSRVVSGKLRLDVRAVDLVGVIEAAIDVVRAAADAKSIRLRAVLSSSISPVSGDPDRLQQVMWNLLSNAVKFTPKGGLVQVRLERVDSHAEITVSDTGQGIAPGFLPHVFEHFRQEDGTTTRRHGGLGLGMAITRHIVELHGGSVSVHSPGEGAGSTFVVALPVMIVHAPSAAPASSRGAGPADASLVSLQDLPSLEGLHVLVVDDQQDGRELVAAVLRGRGARVTSTDSAEDAVAKVSSLRPDVLISDIEMPNEDGYSLIARARALGKEGGGAIPAIALTAHARFGDRMRALEAGYQIHVPKPVDPAELVMIVANVAGHPWGAPPIASR
jgi:PAS domain S-box-containing protein